MESHIVAGLDIFQTIGVSEEQFDLLAAQDVFTLIEAGAADDDDPAFGAVKGYRLAAQEQEFIFMHKLQIGTTAENNAVFTFVKKHFSGAQFNIILEKLDLTSEAYDISPVGHFHGGGRDEQRLA